MTVQQLSSLQGRPRLDRVPSSPKTTEANSRDLRYVIGSGLKPCSAGRNCLARLNLCKKASAIGPSSIKRKPGVVVSSSVLSAMPIISLLLMGQRSRHVETPRCVRICVRDRRPRNKNCQSLFYRFLFLRRRNCSLRLPSRTVNESAVYTPRSRIISFIEVPGGLVRSRPMCGSPSVQRKLFAISEPTVCAESGGSGSKYSLAGVQCAPRH